MKCKSILAAFLYSEDVASFLFPLVGNDDFPEYRLQSLVIDLSTGKSETLSLFDHSTDTTYIVQYRSFGKYYLYVVYTK